VLRWEQPHHLHEGGGRQVRVQLCKIQINQFARLILGVPIISVILPCSYRITVGNKTCVFEKEKDPTVLRSPSAGKLLQYVVEDGGHVVTGDTYAEIEVTFIDYDQNNIASDYIVLVVFTGVFM